MKLGGKHVLAVLLIGLGALMLFHHFGFLFGHLMSWIIPIALCFLGYVGLRNGSKFFGFLFFVLGAIMLLGKLSGLIGILIAVALIVYGLSLFRKRDKLT